MKCLVEIWNNQKQKSEWVQGEVVGTRSRIDLSCDGYDVKVNGGIYEGCHPDCVKITK
jgi:hypothetical protein